MAQDWGWGDLDGVVLAYLVDRVETLRDVEDRVMEIVGSGAHDFRDRMEDGFHWCLWYQFEMATYGAYESWSLDSI